MPFELENQPPTTMRGVVVSATTKHVVLMLPEWSQTMALYMRHDDPMFPRGYGTQRPAVNVEYECTVDLNVSPPRVLSWKLWPEETDKPTPLPAPSGLPGPPDLIPVRDDAALQRVITQSMGKLNAKQREAVGYLVRRAHGQGFVEGRRA